jgi:hypothetical protein
MNNVTKPIVKLMSQYSDWQRAGRQRGQSLSPGRVKNFLFSMSSRLVQGPTLLSNGYQELFLRG